MKKLLVVLLALALPVAADGPVVCSETPQSPGTSCSAAVQSSTNCVCVAAEAGSAEPSVYDDAVSLWRLDEASGTRADSIGSNDLTDNNTVGSTSKGVGAPANLPGTVASFVEGNSEYLSRANADLTNWPQGDFHFAVWATRTGTDADFEENYASKLISTGDQREWRIHTAIGQDRLYLAASSDGTSEDAGANTGAGSFPVNTWHLLELRRSGTTIGVAIDGGAFADASVSGVFNGTAAFVLGARNSGTFGYHDGMLSTAALWPRVLTPDERAALYNSGDGAVLP